MTREEAMELMVTKAFQEEREAAGKWVRAQLTSAQLSTYFVGFLEHRDLRAEVEKAQVRTSICSAITTRCCRSVRRRFTLPGR